MRSVMRLQSVLATVVLASIVLDEPLVAQESRTGVVHVTVEESMGMVSGLLVRSAGRSALTDSAGSARLVLPAGQQVLSITRIGFKPTQATVIVVADSVVTVNVTVEMAMA